MSVKTPIIAALVLAALIAPTANASPASPAFRGGEKASVKDYPFIIAGERAGGPRPQGQTCTGSVVAPRKILIAAHCKAAEGEKSFVYGLDDLNASGGFKTKVVDYTTHPKYVNFDQGYDVAVVTVAEDIPVPDGKYAKVATSADTDLNKPGKTGLGLGYGKKDVDDTAKDVTLEKAGLPLVDPAQCTGVGNGVKPDTMICAGYSDGHVSILPGDSGGPLVVDGKIVGVASWSRSDFFWYSIYGRLNNDMGDWVQEQIGGDPNATIKVANPGDQTTKLNDSVRLQIKATDTTPSVKLTYSASGLPSGLSIDPASGLITGTANTEGVSSVTVTVTDDAKGTGSTKFTWTVGTPPAGTVTVTNPGNQWGFTGYPLFQKVQIKATASDGGALTFSATGLPAGVSISDSGLITGTPTAAGTSSVTVTAKEANGANGSTTFSFQVYGV